MRLCSGRGNLLGREYMRNSIIAVLFLAACPTPASKYDAAPNDVGSNQLNDMRELDGIVVASTFEQGCAFDTDCVLVGEGDLCLCAPCEEAAISVDAIPTYDAARDAIVCEDDVDPLIRCENDCPMRVPVCANQQCDARTPTFITGDMYRSDCETADDCVLISTGEVCSVCRCGRAAIHKDDVAMYQRDSNVECSPPDDVMCECEPATEVECVEQNCRVRTP